MFEVHTDQYWMQKAFEQALLAQQLQEIPVGAVLVDENQTLIGSGHNTVETTKNPSGHAEIHAIHQASQKIQNHRLVNSTLYITLEPCCMCAGLIVHARIKRIVFACRDFKTGAAGSVYNLLKGYPLNHQVEIDEGIMENDCARLLSDFFKSRR